MKFRPAHAGASATEQRPMRLGPESEGPMVKKKTLIIIDGDPRMIVLGRTLLGNICEIPKDIPHVTCLKDAKKVVDALMPDIVLIGKRIDTSPDAHYDLLYYTKDRAPSTIVILWSGGLRGDEYREGATRQYDAMVHRTDSEVIQSIVKHFSESA